MGKGNRVAGAVTLGAGLVLGGACSPGDDYPSGWPAPLVGAAEGGPCADLSGRYAIDDGTLGAVFARPREAGDHAIHWHTVEISDDGARGLVLEFFGAEVGDAFGEPPVRRTRTLDATRCRDGWVARAPSRDLAEPIERDRDDPRAVDRSVLLARDEEGNLVAQEVIERYQTISLWAPGGADVRVPFTGSIERRWSRWLAATDDPAQPRVHPLAGDPSPRTQALGRLLPPDAEVVSRRSVGDSIVLELRLSDTGELVALEERLLESAEFGDARLSLVRHLTGGGVVAALRVPAR